MKISLLGATGSVGVQTLAVVRQHPAAFQIVALAFGSNIQKGAQIIREFSPEIVSVATKDIARQLAHQFPTVTFYHGMAGLIEVATFHKSTMLVNAILGSRGLLPTLRAIESHKTIALANKETLVTAGHLVMDAVKKHNVTLLPVDSEHSAIFQSLQGNSKRAVDSILLTASGGSFRDKTREQLANVTLEDALNHPNWAMGPKITIDSATLFNKGLEVIEAHWLFGLPYDKINVTIHRESIIHSCVNYVDGSMIAQMGAPDMRLPIQYALTYPNRLPISYDEPFDLNKIGQLSFEAVDMKRFRALYLSYEAGKAGGSMPTVLNAANEVAVEAFLTKKISFLEIENLVEKAMLAHSIIKNPELETILAIETETRQRVTSWL